MQGCHFLADQLTLFLPLEGGADYSPHIAYGLMPNIESNDSLNGGLKDYNNNSDRLRVEGILHIFSNSNVFLKQSALS